MYDVISFIGENKDFILQHLSFELKKFYTPITKHTFFDCTNFYFEIDKENDFQKRGPEKNKRHNPIVDFGLLMDANAIPLSYTVFPGNQSEQPELHKNAEKMKKNLNINGRTIYIADKGLNSGDNMKKATDRGDGYIIGQKVRGDSNDLITWLNDDTDFKITLNENNEVVFKIKSEIGDSEVDITSPLNGQKAVVHMRQKRVLFYSKDYADKSKHERAKLIAKAYDLIKHPKDYKKALSEIEVN